MQSAMSFQVQAFKGDRWKLTPITGRSKGILVAIVDALVLNNVIFTNEAMHGTIESIWGASVADLTYDDNATLSALRINRVFRRHGLNATSRRVLREVSSWTDCKSGRRILRADRAVMHGASLYVSDGRTPDAGSKHSENRR